MGHRILWEWERAGDSVLICTQEEENSMGSASLTSGEGQDSSSEFSTDVSDTYRQTVWETESSE